MQKVSACEKFTDSLIKLWSPLPDVWPTVLYLYETIGNSTEYKDYCKWRIDNPKQAKMDMFGKSEEVLKTAVSRVVYSIQDRWIRAQQEAKTYDMQKLRVNYDRATTNILIETSAHKNPSLMPGCSVGSVGTGEVIHDNYTLQPENLFTVYFASLERALVEKLYAKNGVYDVTALYQMLPESNSPLFSRERIMATYMELMEQLKPRGEEWRAQILSLREIVNAKEKVTK